MKGLLLCLSFGALHLALAGELAAECLSFTVAQNHIGETRCVSGKVFAVRQGARGIHYLNYCENYQACPFTVVVFASDLRHVGDVRQLAGKLVEVHGPLKLYDGRAEIILRDVRQLSGEAAQIPQLPKNYDVEKKGRYSAGKFSHPTTTRQSSKKRQTAPIPTEETNTEAPD